MPAVPEVWLVDQRRVAAVQAEDKPKLRNS